MLLKDRSGAQLKLSQFKCSLLAQVDDLCEPGNVCLDQVRIASFNGFFHLLNE